MTLTLHNNTNNTNNNNDNCKFYVVHINKEAFAETACEDNYLLFNLHQEGYQTWVKKHKCRSTDHLAHPELSICECSVASVSL